MTIEEAYVEYLQEKHNKTRRELREQIRIYEDREDRAIEEAIRESGPKRKTKTKKPNIQQ